MITKSTGQTVKRRKSNDQSHAVHRRRNRLGFTHRRSAASSAVLIAAITSGSNALGIAERLMSLNLKHAASEIDDLTEKLKVVAEADGKGFTEEFGHGRHVKVSSPSMYFVPDMKPCAFHEWVPASKCSPPTLSVMQRYWLGAAPTAVIASAIAAPQMVTPRMISQCRALVHAFFRDLTAGADQLLAVAAERPARGEAH